MLADPLRAARVVTCGCLLGILAGSAMADEAEPPPSPIQPTITILSPGDGTEVTAHQVIVRLAIHHSLGEPVTGVRVLVDGQVAAQARGLSRETPGKGGAEPGKVTHTLVVPVPPKDCELLVLAEAAGATSPPARVHLRWRGRVAPDLDPLLAAQPRLYVLAVGVSSYRKAALRLQYPAKDATDLAAFFQGQKGRLYRDVQARVLTNEQASKDRILDGLEWLQRETTAKDVAVLFLAGHGISDPATGGYYFLPYEADEDAVKRTMLPDTDIKRTLSSINGKAVLFVDSCHSGKVFGSVQARAAPDFKRFVMELADADNGAVVFAASAGRQASLEAEGWRNGAFTKAVLEGLRGRADRQHTGRITLNMLDLYISERVKDLTRGIQTPTTAKPSTISDFPLAVTLPGDDPPPRRPLYKRWWFWAALGGVAAGAVIAAAVLGTPSSGPSPAPSPPSPDYLGSRSPHF